jgi:hypothetical protein
LALAVNFASRHKAAESARSGSSFLDVKNPPPRAENCLIKADLSYHREAESKFAQTEKNFRVWSAKLETLD